MKQKTIAASVKDIDSKKRIVCGYFADFGTKDSDSDVIEPGSFKKSIGERGPDGTKRIKHLKNHNRLQVPGVLQVLKEDNKGLYFEAKMAGTTLGNDTLIEYQEGIITEHSIGYDTIKENFSDGANHLLEIKLWEGSSLTSWGANEHTPFVGLKDFNPEDLMKRIATVQKALKIGSFSDEKLQALEQELKQIEETISLITGQKPDRSTSEQKGADEEVTTIMFSDNLFTDNLKL